MNDYAKSLEDQNEELRQTLIQAQKELEQPHMPRWVLVNTVNLADDDHVVTFWYMLNNHIFGFVEYKSTKLNHVYGKTKSGTFEGTSVDEIKRLVEQDFKTAFIYWNP